MENEDIFMPWFVDGQRSNVMGYNTAYNHASVLVLAKYLTPPHENPNQKRFLYPHKNPAKLLYPAKIQPKNLLYPSEILPKNFFHPSEILLKTLCPPLEIRPQKLVPPFGNSTPGTLTFGHPMSSTRGVRTISGKAH